MTLLILIVKDQAEVDVGVEVVFICSFGCLHSVFSSVSTSYVALTVSTHSFITTDNTYNLLLIIVILVSFQFWFTFVVCRTLGGAYNRSAQVTHE